MAHLIKRGPKKWQVRIESGRDPETGKRKRIYRTVNGTKKEAEKVMAEMIKGGYQEGGNVKLKKYLVDWFEDYRSNVKHNTARLYKGIIYNHLIPSLGELRLNEIKPMHILEYQNQKLSKGSIGDSGGLSNRTVESHHRLLSMALKHAVSPYGLIESNPCQSIKAPTPSSDTNPLSRAEVEKFLESIEGEMLYTAYYLLLNTGMRRSEFTGLKCKDISFERQIIEVERTGQMVGGEFKYQGLKNKSSRRQIALADETAKILKKYKKKNAAFAGGEDPIFITPDGLALRPDYLTQKFKSICRDLNMGEYKLHDLRHTHATWLLEAGINPKVVQERLGHARVETTLNIYSHVSINEQKKAVQKLHNQTNL
ncbi:site-specific integrase [Halarsenatibacter silvermanii]|uniref:AP2-like DNA-binding integrase domain-containing protein n=1 Tax=Halarsenatibacter silvermanii TaxID=321763 RepID=A0A1G9NL13_9FIRM|nr:site-specific integrase [Halarsenatibacter silvermanii]SDL87003.1 AP2-like DNA-binding integrase domain-containing protein [Halarsenatibacter silvermanii]